jgi:alpha,alpha-trehalose-phosphate synthase [UDP-forming]
MSDRYDFVVIANRLPVDRRDEPDGSITWLPSPGGLVAALEPVLRRYRGAWVGWTGSEGEAPPPFDTTDMHLVAVPLSAKEIASYYEGMSNATLWPLYHDVIAPPRYHRHWWDTYVDVNRRFADVAATKAARRATVWVQDYQLQMVPRLLRDARPDLRIGFFNHIPFPPYELFAQLPWRRQLLDGLLGADLVGFQRPADANNFLRACRRVGLATRRGLVPAPDMNGERLVRAQAFPISVDAGGIEEIAKRPEAIERARGIREELGGPELILLGVDRLDYTKGILHRLQAVEELYADRRLKLPGTVLVQVATPSRERVESYRALRDEVEATVGRINGEHSRLGHPAVHYLHRSFPKDELVAMYLAADVLLVTALRDGMNLVAKEYVASRWDEHGALVLSEFTGASIELPQAYVVNPHDIEGVKASIVRAATASPRETVRRMRAMRKRVFTHDVARWADDYLRALERSAAVNENRRAGGDLDDFDLEPLDSELRPADAGVTTPDTSRSAQEETMTADVDLSGPQPHGGVAAVQTVADVQVLQRRGEQADE